MSVDIHRFWRCKNEVIGNRVRGISLIKLALGIILAVVVTLLVLQFHRNGHSPAWRFLPDRGQVLPIDPPGSTAAGFESPSGYDQVRASVRRVGEQVSKTFAICKAEPVSLWVAYPLHIDYLAVRPLNRLLNRASGFLLALFGVRAATRTDVRGGEELSGLVANSKEHGELQKDQSNMLNNLLEFDQPPVGRVMIRCNAAHCLDVAAGAESNLTLIKESEHSRFPVIDGRNDDVTMGILLARDLCRALLDG